MSRPTVYPFADLEIGESFTIPAHHCTAKSAYASCRRYELRLGRCFTRTVLKDGSILIERVATRERFEPLAVSTAAVTAAKRRLAKSGYSSARLQQEVEEAMAALRDAPLPD